MTVLDDKLIIAGGRRKPGVITNEVLALDEGEWKDYSKMPTARCEPVAVGFQSVLIVIGGRVLIYNNISALAITELLDTTNGCWYTCDDLPAPHRLLKVALIRQGLHFWWR